MNRGQIIALAMKRAEIYNSPDMVQNARQLMNLAIKRLVLEYKWEHLNNSGVSLAVYAGQRFYSLPSDYVRTEWFKFNDEKYPTRQRARVEFDKIYAATTVQTGKPQNFKIERTAQPLILPSGALDPVLTAPRIIFDRIPDQSYPGTLTYYYMPVEVDVTDSAAFDLASMPFEDHIMLECMVFQLFDFKDDERTMSQWQRVDQVVKLFQQMNYDLDEKQDKFQLDSDMFLTGDSSLAPNFWRP